MKSLYKSIDLGILSLTHIINYLTLVAVMLCHFSNIMVCIYCPLSILPHQSEHHCRCTNKF